ncbi:unnamed protein product [Ectocarpus sp. 13 AM-2016]
MRLPRRRRPRSQSKERARNFRRRGEETHTITTTSVVAFSVGALLVVFLWARLQTHGVRGPWARAARREGSKEEDSLEWLRLRKQYLIGQLAIADSQLAQLGGADNSSNVHDTGLSDNGDPLALPRTGSGGSQRGSVDVRARGDGVTGEEVEAEGHFILGLSAEGYGSTPVDEMMARYDTRACDGSFGNGLVDAWRRTGTECCQPPEALADGPDASSIHCHLIHQDDHHGNGDNLVHMKNVQLDLEDFKDQNVATRVMRAYKNSQHEKQAYVGLRRGAVRGTCSPKGASWQEKFFPGWNADWTTKSFQPVDQLECDGWVDHPVMVIQRDTFANLFHDSEDFVNAFLAMSILRKRPGDVQVLLTDLYPRGPFWPMWDKVFGVGRPTLTAWDVGLEYGTGKVCFRDLTVGIFGPAAPTTMARMVTPCFHTALVRAYSDFVIRGLDLQGMTSYASPPSKKVVVTWMARRSSVQWPERAFCSEDGRDSFFTCEYFSHLDTRELQRKVKNEADVVRGLQALEGEEFSNGAVVEVRDADYNLLSFEEQIKHDLETDVMIGPHGAGLFHIIFTPDRASLIELQIDQTKARKHFNNLAKWSGHGYKAAGGPNPVNVADTVGMVREAIGDMDLSRH